LDDKRRELLARAVLNFRDHATQHQKTNIYILVPFYYIVTVQMLNDANKMN